MVLPERANDDLWLDADAGPVVRPYAMTRGRTRPTSEFDLISLVVASVPPAGTEFSLGPEHAAIVRMCERPLSVAEVAAYLDLPVGIVRVMLGDLLDKGFISACRPERDVHLPTDELFEAVIDGLRAL
jgi:hypothetical protein